MFRPGRSPLAHVTSDPRPRRQRRAYRICAGAMTTACALYLASPYVMLWSAGTALKRHDRASLCSYLDWEQVRAGLKDTLGLRRPVQQVSQQDELPGFGESFATGVASGMIDEDVTPERLDTIVSSAMSSGTATRTHAAAGMPHGYFAGPAHFVAEIHMTGGAPIEISMRIEKWHWKITRITLPEDMLIPAAATHLASTRS